MGWSDLLEPEIQDFIKTHHESDVRQLALKGAPDASWPYALILDQIKVRQKAKSKALNLCETDGFIFPESGLFEQASSQACAYYKTRVFESGARFIDLTAGAGIDGFAAAQHFDDLILIERNENNAELLAHNASIVAKNARVVHADANDYVLDMPQADVVFIDPQRREKGHKGFFAFEDCSPNVIDLLEHLPSKTKKLVVKASPLLDVEQGILNLMYVSQVHLVQWQRECKEVLFVLDFERETEPDKVQIIAVDLDDDGNIQKEFTYVLSDEKNANVECAMPQKYIYEPDPAFQKAGGFKMMAQQYGVKKLHLNTHLYTAEFCNKDFPGRVLEINDILPVQKKSLKVKKADLRVRNFPSTVEALRKKLALRDGGEHRIYATTLNDGSKKLIICDK